jgi:peptidoglycan/LPS O-acetylase OafA/YrhL
LKIAILFVAFFIVCFNCFAVPDGWLARTFSWTPVRWLGNMSYSYYLLHGLTLRAAFLVLATVVPATPHGPFFFVTLLPVMFAITLLPTTALFLLIERPFSLVRRRARVPAPDAHVEPVGERNSTEADAP